MKLDFSGLMNTKNNDVQADLRKDKEAAYINTNEKQEKPLEGNTGAKKLINAYRAEEADSRRAAAIYKTYQDNIKRAGTLRTEIIKGVQRGESKTSLFLKAVEVIGLMTNDNVFVQQVKDDVRAVWGHGYGDADTIRMEVGEMKETLERLNASISREEADGDRDTLQRLKNAAQRHSERLDELERILQRIEAKKKGDNGND